MKIITNHHKRELIYGYDLPDGLLESDFEWADEMSEFFCYRGQWYCLSEFMRIGYPGKSDPESPLAKWDGFAGDSFFSGIAVKFPRDEWGLDTEHVIVALVLA